MARGIVAAGWLAIGLAIAAGCGGEARPKEAASPAAGGEATASVRLEAVIYETRLPAERLAALDADRLAQAGDLQKTLDGLGPTRVLYRVDQAVSLAGDRIHIGKREPIVTGSRVMDGGRVVNTVQYREVGAMFEVKGRPAGADRLEVDLNIEMAVQGESPAKVGEGVPAAAFRRLVMSRKGPVGLGNAAVLVSADATSQNAEGRAVANVCRVVFGRLAP